MATPEAAGVARARILATVLPNDDADVLITLPAGNPSMQMIARGDAVAAESKLVHAGANKVALPTHIARQSDWSGGPCAPPHIVPDASSGR